MDTYVHKRMASIVSLEKIEIIKSQGFMASKARLKFLKKMIILGPKTAILEPQFCRIWCWGLIFGCQGGPGPPAPPPDPPLTLSFTTLSVPNSVVSYISVQLKTC